MCLAQCLLSVYLKNKQIEIYQKKKLENIIDLFWPQFLCM